MLLLRAACFLAFENSLFWFPRQPQLPIVETDKIAKLVKR
jgi:hypothetical protein